MHEEKESESNLQEEDLQGEETEYDGITYFVDEKNNIYAIIEDEIGDIVWKYINDKVVLS